MLEKRIVFESANRETLPDTHLIKFLQEIVAEEIGREPLSVYQKIQDAHEPVNFGVILYPNRSFGEIAPIDIPVFASDVLKLVESYRMIGREVVKEIRLDSKQEQLEGNFIITHRERPFFRISAKENGNYIFHPTVFQYYSGEGQFEHTPILDDFPHKIELCLRVQDQKKEVILVRMYEELSKHYMRMGVKDIEYSI